MPSLLFEVRYSPASGASSIGVVYGVPAGSSDMSANVGPLGVAAAVANPYTGLRLLRVAAAQGPLGMAIAAATAVAAAAATAAEKRRLTLMRLPPTTVNISRQVSAGESKF